MRGGLFREVSVVENSDSKLTEDNDLVIGRDELTQSNG